MGADEYEMTYYGAFVAGVLIMLAFLNSYRTYPNIDLSFALWCVHRFRPVARLSKVKLE